MKLTGSVATRNNAYLIRTHCDSGHSDDLG